MNRGAKGAFGRVVGRLDTLLIHEGEEVRQVQEQRAGEIPYIVVGRVDVPARQREELLLDWQHLGDQLLARERRAPGVRIAPEAMPQAEEKFLQGERLAAKAQGRGRLRQLLRAEEVPGEVRPTELALGGRVGPNSSATDRCRECPRTWDRADGAARPSRATSQSDRR